MVKRYGIAGLIEAIHYISVTKRAVRMLYLQAEREKRLRRRMTILRGKIIGKLY